MGNIIKSISGSYLFATYYYFLYLVGLIFVAFIERFFYIIIIYVLCCLCQSVIARNIFICTTYNKKKEIFMNIWIKSWMSCTTVWHVFIVDNESISLFSLFQILKYFIYYLEKNYLHSCDADKRCQIYK